MKPPKSQFPLFLAFTSLITCERHSGTNELTIATERLLKQAKTEFVPSPSSNTPSPEETKKWKERHPGQVLVIKCRQQKDDPFNNFPTAQLREDIQRPRFKHKGSKRDQKMFQPLENRPSRQEEQLKLLPKPKSPYR
jgi:hypothetical protein